MMALRPNETAVSEAVSICGGFPQAIILPNRAPAASGVTSMGIYCGMSSRLRDRGCVFDQQPALSPSSQLLNEAQEPLDDETENETFPIRVFEEPANNVATDTVTSRNVRSAMQSFAAEEFVDFFSPVCDGGYIRHPNSVNTNQYGHFDVLALVSQCEAPSAADLERNVDPYADEMSPKTYQEMIKSINEDIYLPFQGYDQVNGMDYSLTFNECRSHGSQDIATSTCYTSQHEQLQLTTSSSIANSALSPSIFYHQMTPFTPGLCDNTIWNSTPCVHHSSPCVQNNTPCAQDNTLYAQHRVSCVWNSTPCVQGNSLCVWDNTSCAQHSAWDSTYIQNAPCVQDNTCVQHSSTCVQDNIPCVQQSNPYVQDNTPCIQDNTPCVQGNTPCARDNIPCMHHSSPCVQENPSCIQGNSPWVQCSISCNTPCVQDSTPCLWDSTPCSSEHSNRDNTICIQHSTPAMQCSEVEQVLSIDRLEVNVTFNSYKSAWICSNWYEKLQVVPEVVKPQQSTNEQQFQIKLPEEALSSVTWCNIDRSEIKRAWIILELARIIANLHQNKVTNGLCFFGGLTLSESVFVTVEPCTGEPRLHIVPNMMAFWQFASTHNDKDPNTPRLGRLQDVKQFVKILEYAIVEPVERKEFTVSHALYSACKYCVGEGAEGDNMPIFYQKLAEMQVKKLELELKEQDKKYSELEKVVQLLNEQVKEQDKVVQLLNEQVKEQDKVSQLLKEQINHLQSRLATAQGDVNANDDIDWLSKEQNTKVSMILTNPSIAWEIALRKILEVVFGKKLLAQSCSVGRRHATNKPLDASKLDVVKGLIFNTYGPNPKITNEAINVIVNSCCSSARRSLKQSV